METHGVFQPKPTRVSTREQAGVSRSKQTIKRGGFAPAALFKPQQLPYLRKPNPYAWERFEESSSARARTATTPAAAARAMGSET